MTPSNEAIGLTVGGLGTLREAMGSVGTSQRFLAAWRSLVEELVTEIRFAYLDGVEAGLARMTPNTRRARAAEMHGERLRALANQALAKLCAEDTDTLRAASAYLIALRGFAEANGLALNDLPIFDSRMTALEQFEPALDPDILRTELDAALETLTAPEPERTTA